MRNFLFSGVLAVSFLAGCMGSDSELYVQEPAEDKSIMVPAGLSSTARGIKNVFQQAGWETFVSGRSLQSTGSVGNYVNVNTSVRYPARYSVWAEYRVFDLCINLTDAIIYDISIVDNVTGEEIAALSGRTCESRLEGEIKESLATFL